MFRKYLFLGLMFALGASLLWMVISGRKQEKLAQKKPRLIEIVQDSKPSATRVYAPNELEVLSIRMEPAASVDNSSSGFTHTLEVRNLGQSAYGNLLVKISYFGPDGKAFETRDYGLDSSIPPSQTVTIPDVPMATLSRKPVKFAGKVLYADLESPRAAKP